jgi:hypothetical protein
MGRNYQRRSTVVPLKDFSENRESFDQENNQKNLNAFDNLLFAEMPHEQKTPSMLQEPNLDKNMESPSLTDSQRSINVEPQDCHYRSKDDTPHLSAKI